MNDSKIIIEPLFTDAEITTRHDDYLALSDKAFDEQYRERAFVPISINYGTHKEEIQYNFCTDTFCPNYHQSLEIITPRASRSVKNYVFVNPKNEASIIMCNVMKYVGSAHRENNNTSTLHSNWSIAEEIKRLTVLNEVVPEIIEYKFHNTTCSLTTTPFDKSNTFIMFGKTSAGSTRYKCKECSKTTSVKPSVKESHSYGQKRNDVVLSIFDDIIRRTPIRQICDKNDITPTTFYNKIEFIYQKCLEFLERHESKLSSIEFNDLYLTSDGFMYSLNNTRRKGKGGSKQSGHEKANANEAITNMIATGDVLSHYVFRADISYDSSIRLEDIESDTQLLHCDHTYSYLRKNERIQKYSYKPQPPSPNDSETQTDYLDKLGLFEARDNFVEGLHVQRPYTVTAHHHLIKKLLNFKRLIIVSDDDNVIRQSIFKVYADRFKNQDAYYFTSQFDKSLTKEESFTESVKARNKLMEWANTNKIMSRFVSEKAFLKISHDMSNHEFYGTKIINGKLLYTQGKNLYAHPLPAIDEGKRYINLISYNEHTSPDTLAEMIYHVSTRTVDNFFQEIRRHINILERPLVGGRGAGKTYIYANYNPKYAQQLATIYRTYYNFIKPRKYYNEDKRNITPAMRIGIADKVYSLKDIVYFV